MDFDVLKAFSKILEILSMEILTLSEDELQNIAEGKARIKIKILEDKESKEENSVNYEELIEELNSIRNRETGMHIVNSKLKTKDDVVGLAKFIDIPVKKSENIKFIKEKIIEATIGYRLRSASIQDIEELNNR
ncbi:MAG: hypothetical protein AB1599_10345 [Planctomycetota bacterium]